MYPTIHSWKANDLNTQGFGALADCISAEVSEVLNGEYTLELTYPFNGIHAEHLATGNVIVCKPNHNQGQQAFRINEIKKSFANSIQVYANHISYDLSGYYIGNGYTQNSLAELFTLINSWSWSGDSQYAHDFKFDTDITSSAKFTMPPLQTLRSWMGGQEGSILDTYGGEWIYDNFNCYLAKRRGTDTGYRISYGKNLAEYEKQKEYNDYSHIIAFWKKSDQVKRGQVTATGMVCPFRVGYYDASKEYEDEPTTAQLNESARAEIARLNPLAQTITVTPAQIGNDIIGLGDSVLICYESVFQTRVIKTVWDVLSGTYKSLVLGSKKANISDTIKSLQTAPSGESGSITPDDYIVKCVNNQNDGYTKWASGKLECWLRINIKVNSTTAWVNPIYYGSISGVNYPTNEFIYYPIVNITAQAASGYVWLAPNYRDYSLTSTGTLYFYSVGSRSNVDVTLNIHCVGKWQ